MTGDLAISRFPEVTPHGRCHRIEGSGRHTKSYSRPGRWSFISLHWTFLCCDSLFFRQQLAKPFLQFFFRQVIYVTFVRGARVDASKAVGADIRILFFCIKLIFGSQIVDMKLQQTRASHCRDRPRDGKLSWNTEPEIVTREILYGTRPITVALDMPASWYMKKFVV